MKKEYTKPVMQRYQIEVTGIICKSEVSSVQANLNLNSGAPTFSVGNARSDGYGGFAWDDTEGEVELDD